MIIRQGDITLIRVADRHPGAARPARVVLAYGEESGHHHAIAAAIDLRDGARRYLVVPEPATLVVEPASMAWRHAPIDLAPGTYEVLGVADPRSDWAGQREYTPEAIRTVGD